MMTAKSQSANNSGQALQQVETKIKGGKMQKGKKGVDAVGDDVDTRSSIQTPTIRVGQMMVGGR